MTQCILLKNMLQCIMLKIIHDGTLCPSKILLKFNSLVLPFSPTRTSWSGPTLLA